MYLVQRMARRRLGLATVAVVAPIMLVGLAGTSAAAPARQEQPAAFVSRVLRLIVADHYAAAWNELFTAHKRVAPRAEYVACERLTPVGANGATIEVLRVVDRVLRVPGQPTRVRGKAVTLRVRMLGPSFGTTAPFTHTFSAVRQGAGWAWILTPSRYDIYRSDACR